MKYALLCILAFGLSSCKENKSKKADNIKAAEDTSTKVDSKKKTIVNHRF